MTRTAAPAVDLELARGRLAAAFSEEGRQWPALAAAVLVTRGRLRVGVEAFAHLLGVAPTTIVELERGGCAPQLAPAELARLAPDVDWAALGLPLGRWPPPPGPRARHPASRRPARLPS